MKRILIFSAMILGGWLGLVSASQAQVYVRVPFVRVAVSLHEARVRPRLSPCAMVRRCLNLRRQHGLADADQAPMYDGALLPQRATLRRAVAAASRRAAAGSKRCTCTAPRICSPRGSFAVIARLASTSQRAPLDRADRPAPGSAARRTGCGSSDRASRSPWQ